MSKCALILCEKKMSEKSKKSLSVAEIVFVPMYELLKTSIEKTSICEMFLLFEKEERTEKLRNFITRNKDSDIFIVQGTNPFVSPDTIEKSHKEFLEKERKITAVISPFCESFAAVWMTVKDFRKHCSLNTDEEISLDYVIRTFGEINEFTSKNDDDFLRAENPADAFRLSEYKRKKITVFFNFFNKEYCNFILQSFI